MTVKTAHIPSVDFTIGQKFVKRAAYTCHGLLKTVERIVDLEIAQVRIYFYAH